MATLSEKKGHVHLLEALTRLGGGETLDIVGDGELLDELESRVADSGLRGRVRLLGARPKEDVADLMRAADLFVLPSLHENLPVVLIEAQASGLPAVATRVGGVPELVDDGAGELVSPGDSAALALAITGVLARLDRFDSAALAARAAERYGYEAIADRWSALYEDLRSSAGTTRSATIERSAASL